MNNICIVLFYFRRFQVIIGAHRKISDLVFLIGREMVVLLILLLNIGNVGKASAGADHQWLDDQATLGATGTVSYTNNVMTIYEPPLRTPKNINFNDVRCNGTKENDLCLDDSYPTLSLRNSASMITQGRSTSVIGLHKVTHENSLSDLLFALIIQELNNCDLVICYSETAANSDFLWKLKILSNTKQVLQISSKEDFSSVMWTSSRCRGYIFLWLDPQDLLTFTNSDLDSWDYEGRYVFTGFTLHELKEVVSSQKCKKTEHVVGLVKSGESGEWSIYTNSLFSGKGVEKMGTWKRNRFTSPGPFYFDKISNLNSITLKAITFVWPPSVMYYKDNKGEVLYPYGLDIEVIRTLAQVLNFTVNFEEPPNDELWGEHVGNGSWTGMMGLIKRDEADMGVANLFVSSSRLQILDYSLPYDSEHGCIMIRTVPPLPRWQALAFPFQLWTWLSLLVGLTLSGLVLFVIARATKNIGDDISSFYSLTFCSYYTFGMHLKEPQFQLPIRTSTQVYIAFLWLYCIIITIAYSTNLTAFLTVKKSPRQVETIKELLDSGMVVMGADSFYPVMLASSPDPNLQAMRETFEVYYDWNEIFRRVLAGKGGLIGNNGYMEFIIATNFTKNGYSSLRVMKECFSSHSIAMALPKYSPLKSKFDQVISWMLSGGLTRKFFVNSLRLAASSKEYGSSQDQQEEGDNPDDEGGDRSKGTLPLSLDHLQGIFFIAVSGWALSLVVFIIEKAIISI